jgi:Ubiquitin-activating enzyme E1 FCCH domain
MPAPGFGADFGGNFGGGGVIYLTNLNPEPGVLITDSIVFTIGVQGSLIDLSTVQITINTQPVFNGFTSIGGGINNIFTNGSFVVETNTANGLVTGDQVTIENVIGMPINGTWTITVFNPTSFQLNDSTFSGSYTGGGLVSLPPAFTSDYITSSYEYSIPDNGYTFTIFSGIPYPSDVTIVVNANTIDGGTSTQTYQVLATQIVIYPPMPFGVPLDNVPIGVFSGEVNSPSAFGGLLANGNGQVFFSPALSEANTGSQIDIDYLETFVRASDKYYIDPPSNNNNNRPWLWGPPLPAPVNRVFPPNFAFNYYPTWNSWNQGPNTAPFVPLKTTQATATGILTDVPTGNQFVILV